MESKLNRVRYFLDFGPINYKRRYYWRINPITNEKEYSFLLGERLNLRGYYKYHHAVIKYIQELHGKAQSIPEIQLKLLERNFKVYKSTISRAIMEDIEITSTEPQSKHQLINNTLFSSHDDIFVQFRCSDGSVQEKRIWLIDSFTGSNIRKDGSNVLMNKVLGFKLLKSATSRNSFKLLNFYQTHNQIGNNTSFQIASDGCRILRKIASGIPNSTLVLSRFHMTQPLFSRNNYAPRKWIKPETKAQIGYYDYLNGDTDKITDYYKNNPQIKTGKTLLSLVNNNYQTMQNWKIAKYGNNAESMASEVRRLVGRRIMGEKSFTNMLLARGWKQL